MPICFYLPVSVAFLKGLSSELQVGIFTFEQGEMGEAILIDLERFVAVY